MLNLDPSKLLIIAVVAVILLGPDRLPAFARQVGAVWRSFTAYRHRIEAQVRDSMPDLPTSAEIARLARSPSALLDHLSTMSSDGDATTAKPELTLDTASAHAAEHRADDTIRQLLDRPAVPVGVRPVAPIGATDPGLN